MPSFVVVASASACWSSKLDDDPPYNPPNPDPNFTPSCPSSAPANGAACPIDGQECQYGQHECDPTYRRARCMEGTWSLRFTSCNPPSPDSCPPSSFDVSCSMPGMTCSYVLPDCGAVTIVCGRDRQWSSPEGQCTPSCPSEAPTAGTSCFGELSCVYGDCDEASHVQVKSCAGGAWQSIEAACPPDGVGGRGGEGGVGGDGGATSGGGGAPAAAGAGGSD